MTGLTPQRRQPITAGFNRPATASTEERIMYITITNPEQFGKDITTASQFAGTGRTLEALQCMQIIATPDKVYFDCGNLEYCVLMPTGAVIVRETGKAVVKAEILTKLFGKGGLAGHDKVDLETETKTYRNSRYDLENESVYTVKKLNVTAGTFAARLDTAPEDMPRYKIPNLDELNPTVTIPYKRLDRVKKVVDTAQYSDSHPEAYAVQFAHRDKGGLHITATNGKTYAHLELLINYKGQDFAIPKNTLAKAITALKGRKANLEIYMTDNQIYLKSGEIIIGSRLAEVYEIITDRAITAKESNKPSQVVSKALKRASKVALSVYKANYRKERSTARLWFSFDRNALTLNGGRKAQKRYISENPIQLCTLHATGTPPKRGDIDTEFVKALTTLPATSNVSVRHSTLTLPVVRYDYDNQKEVTNEVEYHLVNIEAGYGLDYTTSVTDPFE